GRCSLSGLVDKGTWSRTHRAPRSRGTSGTRDASVPVCPKTRLLCPLPPVIAGAGPRTLVRIRAHSMPLFLPCQDRLFVWRYASVAVPTERICGRYSATSDQDLPSSA